MCQVMHDYHWDSKYKNFHGSNQTAQLSMFVENSHEKSGTYQLYPWIQAHTAQCYVISSEKLPQDYNLLNHTYPGRYSLFDKKNTLPSLRSKGYLRYFCGDILSHLKGEIKGQITRNSQYRQRGSQEAKIKNVLFVKYFLR